MAECRWLKPQLAAQIEYADWTDVNYLRHSKFILRDDKVAAGVKREQPVGENDLSDACKKRLSTLGT